MRRAFLLNLVGLLFYTGLTSSLPAEVDWTIYLHRAGPVHIGMSLAQVRRVLRDPNAQLEGNTPEVPIDECGYLRSRAVPKGLSFMFAKGRVVRIDVYDAGFVTASGVRVGNSEDKIKQLYPGRITSEPHKYLAETGHYLNYSPAAPTERGLGMVFETDGNKITSFRAGTLAAIALVEGCS